MNVSFCDISRNLIPFVQFKKREKPTWMSVTRLRNASHITTLEKKKKSLPPYDDKHLHDDRTHTFPHGYYKTLANST